MLYRPRAGITCRNARSFYTNMNKYLYISLMSAGLISLSSCGDNAEKTAEQPAAKPAAPAEPAFSVENPDVSLEAMMKDLSEEDQMAFGLSLLVIVESCGGDDAAAMNTIDGKTVKEIMAYAQQVAPATPSEEEEEEPVADEEPAEVEEEEPVADEEPAEVEEEEPVADEEPAEVEEEEPVADEEPAEVEEEEPVADEEILEDDETELEL